MTKRLSMARAKLAFHVRRNKFGNKPTYVDGIRFASKKEAKRYGELKLLERAGEITGLERQPRFDCIVNGHKVCAYVGDFTYVQARGKQVVEDVKGYRTREFVVKWALVQALFPHVTWRLS